MESIDRTSIDSIFLQIVNCSVNQTLYVSSDYGINVIMFEKKHKKLMCIYMHERPSAVSVCVCSNSSNMSFLEIKYPTKRTALVDEYVKAIETVRRRNMVNREMKLAIGEELQTIFHPLSVRLSRLLKRRWKSWHL